MVPVEQRGSANDVEYWEDAFQAMISTSDLRAVDVVGDREGLRRDVRRIASTLFCSTDIDRSIVAFAIRRTATHWGLAEHDVDALVTTRLLQKTASLIRDLRWLGAEQPDPQRRPIQLAA
jgi:hypothetical protein